MDLPRGLVWLHISGNIVWIGAILAVAAVLTSPIADPKTRGSMGVWIYTRLAAPAFVVSFVFGTWRLLLNTSYYLVEHHWMHAKLLFALAAIGLHHVIGGRAKKLARGTVQEAGPTAMLSAILAVMAVLAAFFAIFRLPN